MGNIIDEAYQKLDDAVMYGVNRGVQTWYNVTGRDKEDLSEILFNLGGISISAYTFLEHGPLVGAPTLVFYFISGLKLSSFNRMASNLREISSFNNTKNTFSETYLDALGYSGNAGLLWGTSVLGIYPFQDKSDFLPLSALALYLMGTSFHVVRSDPPAHIKDEGLENVL